MQSLGVSKYGLGKIKKQDWHGYAREAGALAASSTGAARVWTWVRQFRPCAFLAFYSVEAVAAQSLVSPAPIHHTETMHTSVEEFVPSVRSLPWRAVLDLRKDRRVAAFRRWLFQQSGSDSKPKANNSKAIDTLWKAFGELKVSTPKEVIKGIASNLPLPIPLNPASVAISGKAIYDAHHFNKKYDWLIFLHTLQKASSIQD
jgi:hypothetical protein